MALAIWGSNQEETLENTLHSLVFCSLYLHSQENTTKFLHILQQQPKKREKRQERKKAGAKKCFCTVYTLFRFFVCSLKSPRINVDVIHRRNNISLPHFYFRLLFLLLLSCVIAWHNLHFVETVSLLSKCVFVFFFSPLSLLCDSLSDHCVRFSG